MMARVAAAALLAGGLLAGCGGGSTVTVTVAKTTTIGAKRGAGAPADLVQFGRIRSLRRDGGHWVLRFDPSWLLAGVTANTAAAEDGAVAPGDPVPNDYYAVDEGHRAFTYLVPADARVTVLARGVAGSRVTVAQLAELVAGRSPLGRPLFEPLSTGVWIRTHIDEVRSIDQQYRP